MSEIQRYCVGTKVLVPNNDGTCVLFSDLSSYVEQKVNEAVEAERKKLDTICEEYRKSFEFMLAAIKEWGLDEMDIAAIKGGMNAVQEAIYFDKKRRPEAFKAAVRAAQEKKP